MFGLVSSDNANSNFTIANSLAGGKIVASKGTFDQLMINNVVIGGKIDATTGTFDKVDATTGTFEQLTLKNGVYPGPPSTPSANPLSTLTPLIFTTDVNMSPDNIIPLATGPFTKTINLGIKTTQAWVRIKNATANVQSKLFMALPGLFSSNANDQISTFDVYVTENYEQAMRWTAINPEENPITLQPLGFSSLRKTYAQLGGFLFGTYSGTSAKNSVVFFNTGTLNTFNLYVRSIYLDNSAITTKLVIDFYELPSTVPGPHPFGNTTVVVFPID